MMQNFIMVYFSRIKHSKHEKQKNGHQVYALPHYTPYMKVFLQAPFLQLVEFLLQPAPALLLLFLLLLSLPLLVLWAIGASNTSLFLEPGSSSGQGEIPLHPGLELNTTTNRERSMRKDNR